MEVFFKTLLDQKEKYARLTFELIEHMIRRYDLLYKGGSFHIDIKKFLLKQIETIIGIHLRILKEKKVLLINVISSLAFETSK